MKHRLFWVTVLILLLLSALLTACRSPDNPAETASETVPETLDVSDTVASNADTEGDDTASPDEPKDSVPESEASTVPDESVTDATYPDGESNPDWPYSPGV